MKQLPNTIVPTLPQCDQPSPLPLYPSIPPPLHRSTPGGLGLLPWRVEVSLAALGALQGCLDRLAGGSRTSEGPDHAALGLLCWLPDWLAGWLAGCEAWLHLGCCSRAGSKGDCGIGTASLEPPLGTTADRCCHRVWQRVWCWEVAACRHCWAPVGLEAALLSPFCVPFTVSARPHFGCQTGSFCDRTPPPLWLCWARRPTGTRWMLVQIQTNA